MHIFSHKFWKRTVTRLRRAQKVGTRTTTKTNKRKKKKLDCHDSDGLGFVGQTSCSVAASLFSFSQEKKKKQKKHINTSGRVRPDKLVRAALAAPAQPARPEGQRRRQVQGRRGPRGRRGRPADGRERRQRRAERERRRGLPELARQQLVHQDELRVRAGVQGGHAALRVAVPFRALRGHERGPGAFFFFFSLILSFSLVSLFLTSRSPFLLLLSSPRPFADLEGRLPAPSQKRF